MAESQVPPTLWVVVPCYNEENMLLEIARRLSEKLTALSNVALLGRSTKS